MKKLILLALVNVAMMCNAQSLEYYSAVSTFVLGSGESSDQPSGSWDANPRTGSKIAEISLLQGDLLEFQTWKYSADSDINGNVQLLAVIDISGKTFEFTMPGYAEDGAAGVSSTIVGPATVNLYPYWKPTGMWSSNYDPTSIGSAYLVYSIQRKRTVNPQPVSQ
jgi:hypothetical protein